MRIRDLTGTRFGRHIAIEPRGVNRWGNYLWLCKCDCGKEHVVPSSKLIQGKSRSCGCLAYDIRVKQLETHGITTGGKPRTFIIWNGMKARCYNPSSTSYKSYGGRGIEVCDQWLIFENFHRWAISNGYADDLEIDRINNDGNYCPENCRWVTIAQNRRNQRATKQYQHNGMTKTLTEWAEYAGVDRPAFKAKLYRTRDIGKTLEHFMR